MHYDRFIGLVQNRAHLASEGEAASAVHATLGTLAERITREEARDLASQLPDKIACFLTEAPLASTKRFSVGEFWRRVAEREHCGEAAAAFHARCANPP